jgi:16S rRNA (guanine527-N7)-methyltransferase
VVTGESPPSQAILGPNAVAHSEEIESLRPSLQSGLKELQLSMSGQQIELILSYVGLLHKWGGVYNLTAIKGSDQILVQHVLDCLSIVNPLLVGVGSAARILDVGSGAGLPAVMIAIACPSIQVVALDAVAKKMAFVQQTALQLRLKNLVAQHARIENIVSADFDLVVSRAFASLTDFVRGTTGAVKAGGYWLAMKGRVPTDEIEALTKDFVVEEVTPLIVPGMTAERCLVWIRRNPAL